MLNELILKKFIKDYKNTSDDEVRTNYGLLEGWMSIVFNIILFAIKLATGLTVHSVSLIADAIHSLSDMLSSFAVIWGFKIASAPADKEHPYGHGRMEYVATLIIAVLLMVTGIEFFKASFQRLLNPEPVLFRSWAVLVILISILAKEWLARFSKDLGTRIDSKALHGDFLHHRSDVITSFMVIVPLFSAKLNINYLDGIIGILVSGYIAYSGWGMVQDILTPLLGESATYEELSEIKSIAMSVEGVKGVHDMMMHKYGKVKLISMHVEVPEEIPFVEAHDIIEELEELINETMQATTVIHIDPLQKMTDKLKQVHSIMKELIQVNPMVKSYHDIRRVDVKGTPTIIMDVVASDGATEKQMSKIREETRKTLQNAFPECTIKIWVEPGYNMTI